MYEVMLKYKGTRKEIIHEGTRSREQRKKEKKNVECREMKRNEKSKKKGCRVTCTRS